MVTIRLTRRGGKKTPFYHVVVTDSRKRQGGTSLDHHHLDAMLDALIFKAKERPRLVHRLDKDTSGLIVAYPTFNTA